MALLTPWEWASDFGIRRDLDYESQNKPYIEELAKLNGRTQEGVEGDENDEDVVRTFMTAPDESDGCNPQADKVESFCAGTSLRCLKKEKWQGNPLPKIAMLDERPFTDGPGRLRKYLTAHGLYQKLKKPVRATIQGALNQRTEIDLLNSASESKIATLAWTSA